jgi:alpha-beta hydrolase superfamily lysophospholipase
VVNEQTFNVKAADGRNIPTHLWTEETPAKAVLMIAHGMGEHILRYRPVAAVLATAGFAVFGHDHRGHGQAAADAGTLGQFGPDGFQALSDDMLAISKAAVSRYPGLPQILLGHSMGSFAAQLFVLEHSRRLAGLVLSGSAALDLRNAAMTKGQNKLTDNNAPFEPARTEFDWLSRDEAEVDAYIADPLCGFTVDHDAMVSMRDSAADLADPNALARMDPAMAIYLFAGGQDPINGEGKWFHPLVARYRAAGVKRVDLDFYEGARHETLNESNRDEVIENLLAWLHTVVKTKTDLN